jgi:hypothetical protein
LTALVIGVVLGLAIASVSTSPSRAQGLGNEQLDQLLAPIALYPDTLLAQVLIASTYPAEVAEAGQWAKQNSNLQGQQLNAQLEQLPWDPSVKALVQTPTVLDQMNEKLDWTQKLGDAFLAQEADVMASVQRLRQLAQDAGQLMSNEQQTVVTEGTGPTQTIVIEQPNPQVMYVPSYNPTVVYGGWPYPSYPPYYWPTPAGYYPGYYPGAALASGLAWGAGFAISAAVWDNAFDWGGGDLNVNVNRNNFTNIDNSRINNRETNRANNRTNNQRWEHNSANRRGTNYRDTATRERYGKTNTAAADARRESRGFDQSRTANQLGQQRQAGQRPSASQLSQQLGQQRAGGAGQLGQQRAGGAGQAGQRPNASQLSQQLGQQRAGGAGQQRSATERRGQASGFDGVRNGGNTQAFSNRGASSRQSMAQNASARGGGGANFSRAGGGASRPSPSVNRGGGGGGRAAGGGGRGGGGRGR